MSIQEQPASRVLVHRHHLLNVGGGQVATLEVTDKVREFLIHGDAQSLPFTAIYESIESGGTVLVRPDFIPNFEGDACEMEGRIFRALDSVFSKRFAERDTMDFIVLDNRPSLVAWAAFNCAAAYSII